MAAKSIDWSGDTEALRAGVSSFGMGERTPHAILETPPVKKASPEEEPGWLILPLSARSEKALNLKKSALADHLENASSYLPDLAYTLQVGRCAMPFRQTIVSKNIEEAVSLMRVESNAPMQPVEKSLLRWYSCSPVRGVNMMVWHRRFTIRMCFSDRSWTNAVNCFGHIWI